MYVFAFLAALLLPQAQPGAALEQFFVGTTEGSGTVQIVLSGKHAMRDHTRGRKDAQGALLLEQIVDEEGEPQRKRSWRLVRGAGNSITGTISDVKGAVAGEFTGNTLHLRYRMKDGPAVEQWITLQPGGRHATNRMRFSRFGLRVATVESVIRKVD